jgi:hypothetical protein
MRFRPFKQSCLRFRRFTTGVPLAGFCDSAHLLIYYPAKTDWVDYVDVIPTCLTGSGVGAYSQTPPLCLGFTVEALCQTANLRQP